MPKPKTGMIKSNIYVDPKVRNGLQYIAKRKGTTYSALIREAMREYVVRVLREEKQIATLEAGSELASNSQ